MPSPTNRGSTTGGQASNATTTTASGAFTPAAGSLLVAVVRGYWSTASQLAFTLSDTIGDTGGTAWVRGARASMVNGVESFDISIWTRTVGTGPGSGTVTATRSAGSTYWDTVLQIVEVTGQSTVTATGLSATNTTASGTSLTLDFGSTPASTSLIVSAIHGATVASPAATVPSGFTALDNSNFDTEQWASAYLASSASQTHAWSTGASADNIEGCALEILAPSTASPSLRLAAPGLFIAPGAPHWQLPLADSSYIPVAPAADIGEVARPWQQIPPGLFLSPAGAPHWQLPALPAGYVQPTDPQPDAGPYGQPWAYIPPGRFRSPAGVPHWQLAGDTREASAGTLVPPVIVIPLDEIATRTLVEAGDLVVSLHVDLLDADESFLTDITDDVQAMTISRNVNRTIHGSASMVVARQLVWGRQRVKPTLTLSSEILGYEKSWVMGIWCLNGPDRKLGDSPESYSVECLDKLVRVDRPVGRSYSAAAGTDVLVEVARIITDELGEAHVTLDSTTTTTTLTNPMAWPADVNWLKVCNELLAAIGYQGLYVDRAGWFRSAPYVVPADRAVTWEFDADDFYGSIVYPDRTLSVEQVPNSWTFIGNNWPTVPVAADGIFVYANQSNGPSSIDALGGGQLGLNPAQVQYLDAVDQAALEAQGTQIATNAQLALSHLTINTGIVPDLHHLDVVSLSDSVLGSVSKWSVQQWDADLTVASFEMRHTWRKL